MKGFFRELARDLIELELKNNISVFNDKTLLEFARADWNDVGEIENLSDEDLISGYHELARIYNGSPSIKEIELESLFAWEVMSRGLWLKSAKIWEASLKRAASEEELLKRKENIETYYLKMYGVIFKL